MTRHAGPLTLSRVEGSSVGRGVLSPPHPSFPTPIGNPSPGVGIPFALSGVEGSTERNGVGRPAPSPSVTPRPLCHVIPRPREESKAPAHLSAPALETHLTQRRVGHPLFPSTKLETYTCAKAQVYVSVYCSPSPLGPIRERGSKGVRVPFSSTKQSKPCLKPQNNQKRPPPSLTFIPSPPPGTELEAEVGAEAPTSASVLLSPSPLGPIRERGSKGVRVPSPSAKQSRPASPML